jgi:RNase H-fold protein (predicted Holliday junction resolvase)
MAKEFNIQDWKKKHLNEQGFDAGLKAAGGFSDEEFDDIISRDIGSPFPGTDEVSNGYKAAAALKDELREITYKKLTQEEIDTFAKEMILHFLDNTTAAAAAKIHFGKRNL